MFVACRKYLVDRLCMSFSTFSQDDHRTEQRKYIPAAITEAEIFEIKCYSNISQKILIIQSQRSALPLMLVWGFSIDGRTVVQLRFAAWRSRPFGRVDSAPDYEFLAPDLGCNNCEKLRIFTHACSIAGTGQPQFVLN